MPKNRIFFATSNENKYIETKKILNGFSLEVQHYKVNLPEIQSEILEKIAHFSAAHIDVNFQDPIFVEDTGLFINNLNGFPGPYSAYVYNTIGNKGILDLLKSSEDRCAYFKTIIGLRIYNNHTSEFSYSFHKGLVNGRIAYEEKGKKWGYDPIFIPNSSKGLTFSELGKEKERFSHRAKALRKMVEYLNEKKLFDTEFSS